MLIFCNKSVAGLIKGERSSLTQHVSLSRHRLCRSAVVEELVPELLANESRLVVAVVDNEGSEEVWGRLESVSRALRRVDSL